MKQTETTRQLRHLKCNNRNRINVTIATNETLPSSNYGDEDIFGYQVGVGVKEGNYKWEVFYSDFEDISISATGGSATHVIEADADAFGVKFSYLF